MLGAAGPLFERESELTSLPFDRAAFADAITELRAQAEKAAMAAR